MSLTVLIGRLVWDGSLNRFLCSKEDHGFWCMCVIGVCPNKDGFDCNCHSKEVSEDAMAATIQFFVDQYPINPN